MSGTFHVWNAVIYLSTAEPKSAMRDGDRGNRGIGNREWSGTEQNGAERSGIRIIRIKIKEKCDIIAVPPANGPCPHGLTAHPLSSGWLSAFCRRVGSLWSVGVSVIEVFFKIEVVVSLL